MEKVAVVCCYNNKEILESMLECGLRNQKNVEIERLFYCNQFKSAAEAYNYALDNSDAEFFVFLHQDIKFLDEYLLKKTIQQLKLNSKGIYGLCGAIYKEGHTETCSNVYHGLQNKNIGKKIETVTKVDGLDEIFVAFHRSIVKLLKFDSKNFDGWHIYVEDLCLQAIQKDIDVFVLPYAAQHKNVLEMPHYMMVYNIYPKEYFMYLKRLRNKHYKKIHKIVCPCFTISTKGYHFFPRVIFAKCRADIKYYIRKWTMEH